jgi:nicotinate-nucleotide adenylyltransferase
VRIGVFGGSFDPPHLSHVAICAWTLALTDVREVLVVPCGEHAFGKPLSGFDHRLRMCELAFADLGRTRVTDVERRLGGTSYTVATLEHLARKNPGSRLTLVVGADALRDRASWHCHERVGQLADFVVFGRGGIDLDEPTLPAPPAISSSDIRERVSRGESVAGLVPASVLKYIEDNGLYGA